MASSPLLHVRDLWKRFGERITAAGVELEVGSGEFLHDARTEQIRKVHGPPNDRRAGGARQRSNSHKRSRCDGPPALAAGARNGVPAICQLPTHDRRAECWIRPAAQKSRPTRRAQADLRITRTRELARVRGTARDAPVWRRATTCCHRAGAGASSPATLSREPLSALDEKIRREMQAQLKDIQRVTGTTFVYVTHDQEEALTMSDRVAVLNWGHLVQVDEPHALFRRPKTKFVASFFRGSNVVEGQLVRDGGKNVFVCSSFQVVLPDPLAQPASPPAVTIRGEDIRINSQAGSDDIMFEAILERMTYRGVYTDYQLRLADGQSITASATSGPDLPVGQPVQVAVSPSAIIPLHARVSVRASPSGRKFRARAG